MELTKKELAAYLPYGLKAEILDYKNDYVGRKYDLIIGLHQWDSSGKLWSCLTDGGSKPCPKRIKPILYPLDYLQEFLRQIYTEFKFSSIIIKKKEFATIVKYQLMGETFTDIVYSQGSFNNCPMYVFDKLVEMKLDIFNLIENNLAIPVTEDFNPYK